MWNVARHKRTSSVINAARRRSPYCVTSCVFFPLIFGVSWVIGMWVISHSHDEAGTRSALLESEL